jgi:hypothetical protein
MGKQIWRKNCQVCQRMKKDRDFRDACLASTYFNPDGKETLMAVNNKYGHPFKMPTLYRHMTVHQAEDIRMSEKLAEIRGIQTPNWQRRTTRGQDKQIDVQAVENTVALVEGKNVKPSFEQALDEFIEVGRAKMSARDIPISAANYIAAIKVKADIEMRTKDRRLDLLKGMFQGAAPKNDG